MKTMDRATRQRTSRLIATVAAVFAVVCMAPAVVSAQDQGGGENQQSSDSKLQRSDRMEFDARLIRGERASGAVFLFQRTPRELPSMVERRRTYLRESVRTLLGPRWARTFTEKRSKAVADQASSASEAERSESSDEDSEDSKLKLSIEETADQE